MEPEDRRAQYLASGSSDAPRDHQRLDLIRVVLADEATWAEPPPQVVDGLLAAIGSETVAPEPGLGLTRRPAWPAVVAGVGTVAAVVALVLSTVSVLDSEEETVVAMTGTELEPSAVGTAAVRPSGSGWWVRLELNGLPPAPEDSYYEGWVWSDDGDGVSIGTFHVRGGNDPVILWSGVELADYPSISVTLQEEDGGPEASDLVVMTGRVADLPGG
jgi:hypothetical protein